jgi:hypothetical protein
MELDEWERIRIDYNERMIISKQEGIVDEKNKLDNVFKHLEVEDLKNVRKNGELPIEVFILCDIGENGMLVSRKWEESLCHVREIFKYKNEAIERDKFYSLKRYSDSDNRYELWLDYLEEYRIMSGETINIITDEVEIDDFELMGKLKEKADSVVINKPTVEKKKRVYSENEDEDDGIEEDEEGNVIRKDEELLLDDEFDDTISEIPDGYVVDEPKSPEIIPVIDKPEDNWGF